jgi:hypothetical protein
MLKSKKRISGRKYPRGKLWIKRRDEAFARADITCEISGELLCTVDTYSTAIKKWRRACDHIIPERMARRLYPGCDPHVPDNLVVITTALHARKTQVEHRIHNADFIGYKRELNILGFEERRIVRAMKALYDSSLPATKEASCPST